MHQALCSMIALCVSSYFQLLPYKYLNIKRASSSYLYYQGQSDVPVWNYQIIVFEIGPKVVNMVLFKFLQRLWFMKDESLLLALAVCNEDVNFLGYILEICLRKVLYHCFLRRFMRPGPCWHDLS